MTPPTLPRRALIAAAAAALILPAFQNGPADAQDATLDGTTFDDLTVRAGAADLHLLRGGSGPAVILLHGFPANWHSWHAIMPALARNHTVLAVDLRGIGVAAAPKGGYRKIEMAEQVVALMDALEIERAAVVGHDMGALVAYAVARAAPERTNALVFIDQLLPGFGLEQVMDLSVQGQGLWHFPFHLQRGMAERLVEGREDVYFEKFWNEAADPTVITPADRARYVAAYRAPGALTAGFEWYRAIFDDARDNLDAAAVGPMTVPTLAITGETGAGPYAAPSLEASGASVESIVMEGVGHWPMLERPDDTAEAILDFLDRHPG